MPKTRSEWRKKRRETYLAGRARSPYSHTPVLRRSLEEASSSSSCDGVCNQCFSVLTRYAPTFKAMLHQGSELKRKKAVNPHPKRADMIHYRDIVTQNDWLRSNVFDSLGNYLYCCQCICAALGICKDRLTRQRNIKRQQSQQPIVQMLKTEVEEKRLGEYVVMPANEGTAFKRWWRGLAGSTSVQVRYPHERHWLGVKNSNSAKVDTQKEFLEFVDLNSQPNGRSADSSGPTSYFIPKFSTIQMPKKTVAHYEERLSRSVVGEFIRSQREKGGKEISNGTSSNWLKACRPKVQICPHQEDYCDTCSKSKAEITGKQTTINRLKQSAQASTEDIKKLEDDIASLKQQLENHRSEAAKSHEYYIEVTKRCSQEWDRITSLQQKEVLSDEDRATLDGLKQRFDLVLSADFQMQKLVPYWGLTPQPGSTYYCQKLNHDIFGICNHGNGSAMVYLFDERVGPKSTDHTVSHLMDYLHRLPNWVRRIHLFLDNTSSTNKNCYMMGWAYEMVSAKRVDFLRISFLIAGHPKFAPDLLFSRIAKTYNRSDVFNTLELKEIISDYAEVVIDEGEIVCDWRNPLSEKFGKLPGIRSLHDFIYTTNSVTSKVVARSRKLCYAGRFQNSYGHVLGRKDPSEVIIPDPATCSYTALTMTRPLTDSKIKHLEQQYRDFIQPDRYPTFLTP